MMEYESSRMGRIESDLGIGIPFSKGQDKRIRNCWHFSTDGNAVDILFRNDLDFRDAMNRIFVVSLGYDVVILAFCLMNTHVHFVLYGEFDECNRFAHEYVRRLSIDQAHKYGTSHKMEGVDINVQNVDTDYYLKTVICYVIRNPYVAGLDFNPWDYPWSSGSLYFRKETLWTSPVYMSSAGAVELRSMFLKDIQSILKTRDKEFPNARIVDGMVFPGEYVASDLVMKIFKTVKSFNYFLFKTKDIDVESRGGEISRLSLPLQDLKQFRDEQCLKMYGSTNLRGLDTGQRILLARKLRSMYNSSAKQIVRLCGLVYEEAKDLI